MAAQLRKLQQPRRDGDGLSAGFGSDVYERYTALYSWQSNQVAHAGMGMLGAAVLVIDAVLLLGPGPWVIAGLAFLAVPFLKDVTDFRVDRSRGNSVFETGPARRRAAVRELVRDWIVDDFHWFTGMILAVGLALLAMPAPAVGPGLRWGYWAVALAGVAIGVAKSHAFYGREKQAIDDAGLLYYTRLARFTGRISEDHAATVNAFVDDGPSAPLHVVIGGEAGTGKTELALAIAAELAVRGRRVRYVSLDAFVDTLGSTSWPTGKDPNEPWPPMQAEYVVVDDLEDHPAVAEAMQNVLTGLFRVAMSMPAFKCRKFVWVAGNEAAVALWRSWVEKTFPPAQGVWTVFVEPRPQGPARPFPGYFLRHLTANLPIYLGFLSLALWTVGRHWSLWVPAAVGAAAIGLFGIRRVAQRIGCEQRRSLVPSLCGHGLGLAAAIVLALLFPA